ncbi:MAG: hypothetical protein Q9221_003740 [Calogaya cf. arnoldii]
MAGSSSHLSLLDLTPDEVEFVVENSLLDSPLASEDEASNMDETPRHPYGTFGTPAINNSDARRPEASTGYQSARHPYGTFGHWRRNSSDARMPETNTLDRHPYGTFGSRFSAFESLVRNTSDARRPDDALTIPANSRCYTPAPNRPSSARVRSLRPAQPLDDFYGTPSDQGILAEGDSNRVSAHASQSLAMDPLAEMQALRARMGMLQSLVPRSNQQKVLQDSLLDDGQLFSHAYELEELRNMQDDAWLDSLDENLTHPSPQLDRLPAAFGQPAVNDTWTFFGKSHSPPQSRYQPPRQQSLDAFTPVSHQQSYSLSAQGQPAGVKPPYRNPLATVSLKALQGICHSRRCTVLYYYKSLRGERLVEAQTLSSSSVLPAQKKNSERPEPSPVGRFHRGQTLRRLTSAVPSTALPQSALAFGQKRRRVMLHSGSSQTTEQASLDDWDKDEPVAQDPELRPGPLAVPYYPVYPFMPAANVVFLSQILPKTFDRTKRLSILFTIRAAAPYVPLCVIESDASNTVPEPVKDVGEDLLDTSGEQEPSFQHPFGPDGAGWPTSLFSNGEHPQSLPVEIFELIGSLLPRDSIQSMRLVNREFERKISCLVFKSVVVPFKPKIYETASTQMSAKAMGKQKEHIKDTYNPREDHVKDGMRVFEEWGPEIKKFALTFEVAEENLTKLKPKRRFEVTDSFWGSYRWPHKHYNRYEQAAKLEQKADETSAMITAFSKLTGIRELGLSILSGLGWLSGKDVSDRARLFRKKPTIFGTQLALPDRELRENIHTWDVITRLETAAAKRIQNKAARSFFDTTKEVSPADNLPRLTFKSVSRESSLLYPPLMFDNENFEAKELSRTEIAREDEAVGSIAGTIIVSHPASCEPSVVTPQFLTSEQEDWLMEMEWAQEAFLSSWCIALLDNPSVFHSLRTFNIATLSSKHLKSLQRDDIWRALPNLQNLTVLVSPDWRLVSKDTQGNVFTEEIRPSSAQTMFWNFLFALFKEKTSMNIKTLTIGYIDGGEHATGMFARNQNILPAPIDQYAFLPSSNPPQETLRLPFVEELTLKNCWLTPTTLRNFFTTDKAPELKSATFESVSLTADTDVYGLNDDNDDDDLLPSTDRSLKWLTTNPLAGSWPDIINTITPGPSIAHARYIHGLLASPPLSPPLSRRKKLESIQFKSCGYVRLPNLNEFNQSSLPELPSGPPQCLKRRRAELQKSMLIGKEDGLLGTVVPCMRDEEEGALNGIWGFEFGWQGEWEGRGWECREDGQPEGGSGRFNGTVERGHE